MNESTFIMIKPHAIQFTDEILSRLDVHAQRADEARILRVVRSVIQAHYEDLRNKPFFVPMTEECVGKPVHIAVYRGDNVIDRLAEVIGPTNPLEAPDDSIRGMYRDRLDVPVVTELDGGGMIVRNLVHRSLTNRDAMREIIIWNNYLNGNQT